MPDPEPTPTPTPDPTPTPTPEVNWLLGLPEEYQNDPNLNTFKTIEDFARSHVELRRTLGDRIKVPADDAPPEELNKFYARLGRPETPDGYEFTVGELPPGMTLDEKAFNRFRAQAHALGLSKKQAEAIFKDYVEDLKTTHTQILTEFDNQVKEKETALKTRWGANYDTNVDLARRTFASFANEALAATVEQEGWGNHPDFVELFHKIGLATKEDVLRQGDPVKVQTAKDRIKQIEADPTFRDTKAPGRKELLEERDRLYKEVYPEPQG